MAIRGGFALLALLLWSLPVRAEIVRWEMRVDGLSCAFCAYGLEKKLLKLAGVQDFWADLKKGLVWIRVKGNPPDEKALQKAVQDAGFTLRELRWERVGRVEKKEDGWYFVDRGTGQRWKLKGSREAGLWWVKGKAWPPEEWKRVVVGEWKVRVPEAKWRKLEKWLKEQVAVLRWERGARVRVEALEKGILKEIARRLGV